MSRSILRQNSSKPYCNPNVNVLTVVPLQNQPKPDNEFTKLLEKSLDLVTEVTKLAECLKTAVEQNHGDSLSKSIKKSSVECVCVDPQLVDKSTGESTSAECLCPEQETCGQVEPTNTKTCICPKDSSPADCLNTIKVQSAPEVSINKT